MTKTMKMLMLLLLTMVGTTAWAGAAQTIRLVTTGDGTVTVKVGENPLTFDGDGKSITTVAAGATITLTVAPAEGYYADVLSVNKTVDLSAASSLAPHRTGDVGTGDIVLTLEQGSTGNLHKSNTYTFTMPSSDYSGVNIAVTFAQRTDVNTSGEGAVTVDDIAAQTYTGQAIEPALTVTYGSDELIVGKDYTVEYVNNTNASTNSAKATVTFVGKYRANETIEKTFDINKAPLNVTAKPKTITYGDDPANDGVEYDGFVNGETAGNLGGTLAYDYKTGADGTGDSYTAESPAGTYYIIPTGLTSTNYDITFIPGTLTVNAKEIEYTGGSITEDKDGYTISLTEGTGSANPLPSDKTVASLTYIRPLSAPTGSGDGDVTIGATPAKLYTVCLPTIPATATSLKYYTLGGVTGT